MFTLSALRRASAAVVVLSLAVLLVGCGGGLRVIKPEVDDAAGLRAVSAYHVAPISYDFDVPAEWDVTEKDWAEKTSDWRRDYSKIIGQADKPVYVLGPGSKATDGAIIETSVTQMKVGTYAYFFKSPGHIWGSVTIRDAKSGNVLFKGSFDSMGRTDDREVMTFGGRVKLAHEPVAYDLRWLINRRE
ncbi:MAG: hypothetical protein KF696_03365 [Planctomycetes bacterium]|nr:hypothetical protein [Planctomycetota bacterium]MCW8135045.1 hypothetical protein [Planctomycetota bacterium]